MNTLFTLLGAAAGRWVKDKAGLMSEQRDDPYRYEGPVAGQSLSQQGKEDLNTHTHTSETG